MTEQIVTHLGYVGIALILVLGGLGLPIPEEAPVILAAVLSKSGKMFWPLALATCLAGVLLGDFVVYLLGYFYGERVMSLRLTRRLLTRAREAQIKGYFQRHGFKILILGRFAVGFRTAAYLTAGILQLPPLRLFLTDLVAASLSTFLIFGLGYVFAQQIANGIREVQHYIAVAIAVGLVALLIYRFYKGRQRAGLPVGPPVLIDEDAPLPPDDLAAHPVVPRDDPDVLLDCTSETAAPSIKGPVTALQRGTSTTGTSQGEPSPTGRSQETATQPRPAAGEQQQSLPRHVDGPTSAFSGGARAGSVAPADGASAASVPTKSC